MMSLGQLMKGLMTTAMTKVSNSVRLLSVWPCQTDVGKMDHSRSDCRHTHDIWRECPVESIRRIVIVEAETRTSQRIAKMRNQMMVHLSFSTEEIQRMREEMTKRKTEFCQEKQSRCAP
jgi:hypothetical protein